MTLTPIFLAVALIEANRFVVSLIALMPCSVNLIVLTNVAIVVLTGCLALKILLSRLRLYRARRAVDRIRQERRKEGLPTGTYTVWESHPASFLDGIDTLGTPALGTVGNDRFTNLVLAGDVHLVNYNFGERGVLNPTKALELASTPAPLTMATTMVMHDEPDSLEAQILQSITPAPPIASQFLDVDGDGHIAAIDVLLVINYINAAGPDRTAQTRSPVLSSASDAPNRCDVDQDGFTTASDVLAIINYINAHPMRAEGEAESDSPDGDTTVNGGAGNVDMDVLVDLIASDVANTNKRQSKQPPSSE
jgi:hypothetical protein